MMTSQDYNKIDSNYIKSFWSNIFRIKERQKQELEEAKMMDEIKRYEDQEKLK